MTKRELVMDILYGPNHDTKETFEQRLNRIADAWEAECESLQNKLSLCHDVAQSRALQVIAAGKDTARLDNLEKFLGKGNTIISNLKWGAVLKIDTDLRSAIDAMGVK